MAVATGIRERIAYAAETVIGETPATPEFQTVEVTGFSINPSKEVIQDNRLGNRNRRCNKHGNQTVSGDLSLLLVHGAYDDLLEAGFCGTWENDSPVLGSDTLVNGDTRRSFTIARENPEIDTNAWRYYRGVEVNTIGLELTQNDNVQLTFGVIGVEATKGQAALAGQTFVAPSTACAYDYKYGSLKVDDVVRAAITGFSFNVENGIEASFRLFSDKTGSKPIGKFDVGGNITLQFESTEDYNSFLAADKVSIELALRDAATDGNEYVLIIPRAMFNSAPTDTGGEGEITITLDFAGEYDGGIDGTAQLVRTAAE